MTRSHFGSSFHPATPWSRRPDWVHCASRMTSLPVWIFTCSKTKSRWPGGDAAGRTVARIRLDLVLIWFWSGSDLIQGEPNLNSSMTGWHDSGLLMWETGHIFWGRGRLLGPIGNMKKQFSLYYISVQSDIYTTQTYILSQI